MGQIDRYNLGTVSVSGLISDVLWEGALNAVTSDIELTASVQDYKFLIVESNATSDLTTSQVFTTIPVHPDSVTMALRTWLLVYGYYNVTNYMNIRFKENKMSIDEIGSTHTITKVVGYK